MEEFEIVYESYVNGQFKQMMNQLEEYNISPLDLVSWVDGATHNDRETLEVAKAILRMQENAKGTL